MTVFLQEASHLC